MTTEHTPGPWKWDGVGDGNNNLVVGAPGMRCTQVIALVPIVVGYLADTMPEAQANARLIAAAPDLLAALRAIQNVIQREEGKCEEALRGIYRIARDAIDRTKGEKS